MTRIFIPCCVRNHWILCVSNCKSLQCTLYYTSFSNSSLSNPHWRLLNYMTLWRAPSTPSLLQTLRKKNEIAYDKSTYCEYLKSLDMKQTAPLPSHWQGIGAVWSRKVYFYWRGKHSKHNDPMIDEIYMYINFFQKKRQLKCACFGSLHRMLWDKQMETIVGCLSARYLHNLHVYDL